MLNVRMTNPAPRLSIVRGAAVLLAAMAMLGEAAPARAQDVAVQIETAPPPQSSPAPEDVGGVGPGAGSGVISFPPSFFAQYRPTNASDMVNRVPGFTMNVGVDVRGFGGSTGNVLIDGQRPSSKSVNVSQFIQGIPINQVVRIDLIRGGTPGIDMQGQPVVVNIIRNKASSSGGAFQLMFKPFPEDKYYGVIPRIEYFWRNDRLSFDWQANGRQDQNFDSGEGRLIRWRSNGTTQDGDFISRSEMHNAQTNASIEYLGLGGILHINGGADRQDTDRREYVNAPFNEKSQVKARKDKAEISGDYQHDFNNWLSGQLLALKTLTDDRQSSFNLTPTNNQQAIEDALGGESIIRGVLSALRWPQIRLEIGAEGAKNFLDATSSLVQNGRPVALPAANIRVEETRAEAFGTATWNPSSRFGVESGLRYETSTINSHQGLVIQEKTLNFAKPRLILSWAPNQASQFRLRMERTVGQLNFKDFAATTQLEAGSVTAGNPNIVPERAWLGEVALERRFWGRGAAVLTLSHAEVSSVVDLIPINNQFDAPGNIGDGWRREVKLQLTLPLDRLGISGGLIRLNQTWRWSEVTDPVTAMQRRISNQRNWEGDFHISKAIPSWKSVVAIEAGQYFEETGYRINEIRSTQDTPLWKFIWDYSPRPDLIFRAQWENSTGKERVRQRTVFTGPRSAGLVNFSERRNAVLAPFFMFRMRKTL